MHFPPQPLYASRRSPVLARNVVAASQPLATQAGISMLQRGGNAVDAALAAAITLVVVEPTGNGLGSDAFAIVWDGTELHGLNASGRSPAGWNPERFAGQDRMAERGWETVTVPGAVAAWADLSSRFGSLPFATLFEPAIDIADRGFHVSPIIAELWLRGAEELKGYPGFADMYMPGGRVPLAGELFRSADLARSLRLIAESNGEAFYRGGLADQIAAFARKHGAALAADDLATHANEWCGTISQRFGPIALHEIPPNGQGIAACMALGILQHHHIADLDPDGADAFHLQIEAMKLAFADIGAYLADAAFMREVRPEHLLDPNYLVQQARLIDRKQARIAPTGAPRRGGTVCLSTADETGMMVSFIQSNYAGFGSGIVVPGTGISLQNRGSGFSLREGHPNEVGPKKRPFHTIIPGFVMGDGSPVMAFGLMGGSMQAQGHLQMVLRTQVWDQDPQTAVDAPRWRFIEGLAVAVELAAGASLLSDLSSRGHQLIPEPPASFAFGGAQMVQCIAGGYAAASDPRKDGHAAGF
jgi:gamma-glutamyltranspeptidase/glutathione hydrolase